MHAKKVYALFVKIFLRGREIFPGGGFLPPLTVPNGGRFLPPGRFPPYLKVFALYRADQGKTPAESGAFKAVVTAMPREHHLFTSLSFRI